jgi:hypothetical protein
MDDSERSGLFEKLSSVQQNQVSYSDILLLFPFNKSISLYLKSKLSLVFNFKYLFI